MDFGMDLGSDFDYYPMVFGILKRTSVIDAWVMHGWGWSRPSWDMRICVKTTVNLLLQEMEANKTLHGAMFPFLIFAGFMILHNYGFIAPCAAFCQPINN